MTLPVIRPSGEGSTLEVRLRTRSSRRGVAGVTEGALDLRVASPPVEGRANEEARRLLAEILGVAPSAVSLLSGSRSRRKVFLLGGLDAGELRRRVEEILQGP